MFKIFQSVDYYVFRYLYYTPSSLPCHVISHYRTFSFYGVLYKGDERLNWFLETVAFPLLINLKVSRFRT